jgi:hypothetical protein
MITRKFGLVPNAFSIGWRASTVSNAIGMSPPTSAPNFSNVAWWWSRYTAGCSVMTRPSSDAMRAISNMNVRRRAAVASEDASPRRAAAYTALGPPRGEAARCPGRRGRGRRRPPPMLLKNWRRFSMAATQPANVVVSSPVLAPRASIRSVQPARPASRYLSGRKVGTMVVATESSPASFAWCSRSSNGSSVVARKEMLKVSKSARGLKASVASLALIAS